jgi:AraC family transcriptional regulator of adaptative response/methylated-DNA-[protein]-cysteine methyltransferase
MRSIGEWHPQTEEDAMNEYAETLDSAIYRYAFADWRNDRIVIVMSEQGVVDVVIGDEDEEILREMCRRFPEVGFVPDRGHRAVWVRAVLTRLERPGSGICVPLDLGGRGRGRLSPCA